MCGGGGGGGRCRGGGCVGAGWGGVSVCLCGGCVGVGLGLGASREAMTTISRGWLIVCRKARMWQWVCATALPCS